MTTTSSSTLDAPNEADLVAELREFLDTIRPEDFGQ